MTVCALGAFLISNIGIEASGLDMGLGLLVDALGDSKFPERLEGLERGDFLGLEGSSGSESVPRPLLRVELFDFTDFVNLLFLLFSIVC